LIEEWGEKSRSPFTKGVRYDSFGWQILTQQAVVEDEILKEKHRNALVTKQPWWGRFS
jgi:hypothetical protein